MAKKRRKKFDNMTPDEQRMLIHCHMAENMDTNPWWLDILIATVVTVGLVFAIDAWFRGYIADLPDPTADCVLSEPKCNGKGELVARRLKFIANQGPFKKQ